ARILAKWGDRHVTRSVISGGSYLSSSSPFIHFGIDPGQAQAELEIQWPSGYVQSILHPLTTDQSGDAWLVVEGTDPVPLPGWNTVR
ncbi:MAG: ASPIC/UnbV domain-containing protein, partial [Planctomycetes bacterium]|nr:ASPIC/UnbV domain-containing protein [Planctomycetota bacterium]